MEIIDWQWLLLLGFGILFLWIAPLSKKASDFFNAQSSDKKQAGLWLLTSSLVISWIFAKSITNAANLGLAFGLVGGVAYAMYYLSFVVAGGIIYQLRTKGGFKSLHHFLQERYGRIAVIIFSVLIGFRLFNEVWSNTMVIGSYFGDIGSGAYFLAIGVFTMLTLAYTLKGGLRSSLMTDAIQMIFFGLLLFIILGILLPGDQTHSTSDYLQSGSWTMATGVNLLLVAFIQVFSYPFHDSVLTDRGFISDPKTTLKSYLLAAAIGFICIVLFSLVGVYAQLNGLKGQAAVEVSRLLGMGMMLLMNFIMITSAASTLDSAFASAAKLTVVDLQVQQPPTVRGGRLAMILFTMAGTFPIFFSPTILSATTISGTMVLGLAPVFIFWNSQASANSFYGAVGAGILVGLLFAFGFYPKSLVFFEGPYGDLLSANIIGTFLSIFLFFTLKRWTNGAKKTN